MRDKPRNLVVLFGAGASHDCGRSDHVQLQWKPPLANQLFSDTREYLDILSSYSGAIHLAPKISRFGEEGFEATLAKYKSSTNDYHRRAFLHVPLYLQELLWAVSDLYSPKIPTVYDELLSCIIPADFDKVLFLTLNYDLLFDQAFERAFHFPLTDPEQFVTNDGRFLYAKLHGSVNWGYRVHTNSKICDFVLEWGLDDSDLRDLEVLESRNHIHNSGEYTRYPCLSVPIPDKTDFSCPMGMRRNAEQVIEHMTHLLLVGFSGKDSHVLELLGRCRASVLVAVVDLDEKLLAAERLLQRATSFVKTITRIDDDVFAYNQGFANYVALGNADKFLSLPSRW